MTINKSVNNSKSTNNDILKGWIFAWLTTEKSREVFEILSLSKKDYLWTLNTVEKIDLEIEKHKENLEKYDKVFSNFDWLAFPSFEKERKKLEDLIKILETKKSRLQTNQNIKSRYSNFNGISLKIDEIERIKDKIIGLEDKILWIENESFENTKKIQDLTSLFNEKEKEKIEIANRINDIEAVLFLYNTLKEQYKNKKNKWLYWTKSIEINNENIEKSEKEIKKLEKDIYNLKKSKEELSSKKVDLYIKNKNNENQINDLNKQKENKKLEITNLEKEIDSLRKKSEKPKNNETQEIGQNETQEIKLLPYLGEGGNNLGELTPEEEKQILNFSAWKEEKQETKPKQKTYSDLPVNYEFNWLPYKDKYDFSSKNFLEKNINSVYDSGNGNIIIWKNSVNISWLKIPRETSDEEIEKSDTVENYEKRLEELSEKYFNNPYFSNKISELRDKLNENFLNENDLEKIWNEISDLEKEFENLEQEFNEDFENLQKEIKNVVEKSFLDQVFEKFDKTKDSISYFFTWIWKSFSELKEIFKSKKEQKNEWWFSLDNFQPDLGESKPDDTKTPIDEFSLDNFSDTTEDDSEKKEVKNEFNFPKTINENIFKLAQDHKDFDLNWINYKPWFLNGSWYEFEKNGDLIIWQESKDNWWKWVFNENRIKIREEFFENKTRKKVLTFDAEWELLIERNF